MKMKRTLTGLMAAAALATAVASPVAAFAATTGTTTATLKASDSNLTLTVPTVIPFVMTADGVLTSSEEAMQITNGSNFTIHVSDVDVVANSPFSLVADAAASDADNAVDFQFGAEDALIDGSNPTVKAGSYNLAPMGADGASIAVKAQGNAKNVKADVASAQTFANITWTFAPGLGK